MIKELKEKINDYEVDLNVLNFRLDMQELKRNYVNMIINHCFQN